MITDASTQTISPICGISMTEKSHNTNMLNLYRPQDTLSTPVGAQPHV